LSLFMSICWISDATAGVAEPDVGLGRDDGTEIGADEAVGLGDDVGGRTHEADVRQIEVEHPDATTEKVRTIASSRPTRYLTSRDRD